MLVVVAIVICESNGIEILRILTITDSRVCTGFRGGIAELNAICVPVLLSRKLSLACVIALTLFAVSQGYTRVDIGKVA